MTLGNGKRVGERERERERERVENEREMRLEGEIFCSPASPKFMLLRFYQPLMTSHLA